MKIIVDQTSTGFIQNFNFVFLHDDFPPIKKYIYFLFPPNKIKPFSSMAVIFKKTYFLQLRKLLLSIVIESNYSLVGVYVIVLSKQNYERYHTAHFN